MVITLLIIAYSPMDVYSRRITTFCRARGITTNTFYVCVAATVMVLCSLALASDTAVPPSMLRVLQLFTIPVSLASKVPQMMELQRDKATGQLSVLVVFAQLLGTLARVFTTVTETNDRLLFWGFALATVFNAVIAVQVLMYWNGNAKQAALHDGRWYDSVPAGRRPLSELPTSVSPAHALPKRD
ncbi:hypothetical protein MYAM1_001381 [Malassezia yamatoensis]|uniref:Mannose-P-dolichol utilization defect 1 protein homolog n=1 Tax=Malassezia yamatoensis TaxID=253288 RepID=A0AAJ6CGW7_9BASI|nr:hypothetical protein MYAM1_001381 [Malassezia yamatoensis]